MKIKIVVKNITEFLMYIFCVCVLFETPKEFFEKHTFINILGIILFVFIIIDVIMFIIYLFRDINNKKDSNIYKLKL